MLPLVFTAADPESTRARYKIVRLDSGADVPGLILSASVDSGLCLLRNAAGESAEHSFGVNGLRIVTR